MNLWEHLFVSSTSTPTRCVEPISSLPPCDTARKCLSAIAAGSCAREISCVRFAKAGRGRCSWSGRGVTRSSSVRPAILRPRTSRLPKPRGTSSKRTRQSSTTRPFTTTTSRSSSIRKTQIGSERYEYLLGRLDLDPAKARVLDVGCGSGAMLAALQERGVSCRGLEVNPGAVEFCRRMGLDVRRGELEHEEDRSYDADLNVRRDRASRGPCGGPLHCSV